MTKTYAIFLLFVAIAALIIGIRAWIKMFSSKEIIKFPFSQKTAEFTIAELGHYAIYIHAKNFRLLPIKWVPRIISTNDSVENPAIKASFFGVRSNNFDGGRMEKFGFNIETPGKYNIEIVEGETEYSRLQRTFEKAIIRKRIFSESEEKDLYISIRKGPSLLQKAYLFPQMFLAFAGLLGIVFSSITIANPRTFDDFGTKLNIENQK